MIDDIEQKLQGRHADAAHGDHSLNDGLHAPAKHRPAAVLLLLVGDDENLSVVFTERTPHLPSHGGQISFPGGKIESSDKDAIAAALREAAEETGLDAATVRILGQSPQYITRSGFCVQPVVGHVERMPRWSPDDREVARIFTVPLAHFMKPDALDQKTVMQDGEERSYYVTIYDDAYIWGATAGMMKKFIDIIGGVA